MENMENDVVSNGPLVSVIMNCFNGEAFLKEAIDSVYAQTYKNWEIIFWDNASNDRSGEIAQSYDGRLRYFRGEETIPLGAARNKAVEQGRGELIAFLDTDDMWLEHNLSRQVEVMKSGDWAVCYGGILQIDKHGNKIGAYVPRAKSGVVLSDLLLQFEIWVPAVMLRTSALRESGLNFDKSVTASEEYCLFMNLAADYPFCALPEILAKYRIHDNSLTNASWAKWAEEREYTLKLICQSHPGIELRYRRGFVEAYARARYYRARYYMFAGQKSSAIHELWKNLFVDFRYFILFVLLLMPTPVWDFVHAVHTNRTRFA